MTYEHLCSFSLFNNSKWKLFQVYLYNHKYIQYDLDFKIGVYNIIFQEENAVSLLTCPENSELLQRNLLLHPSQSTAIKQNI